VFTVRLTVPAGVTRAASLVLTMPPPSGGLHGGTPARAADALLGAPASTLPASFLLSADGALELALPLPASVAEAPAALVGLLAPLPHAPPRIRCGAAADCVADVRFFATDGDVVLLAAGGGAVEVCA
jgi:hypothetical protein